MAPRSTHVTVIGILFAGFYGLSVLGAAMQLVVMLTLFDNIGIDTTFAFFPVALGALFLLQAVVAIALVRRSPWSRRWFIGLRIFDIVLMLAGVVAIVVMAVIWGVGADELMIQAFIVVMWIPFAMAYVLIIRLLRKPEIRAEFEG